jgi:hypothetical protein
MYYTEVVFWRGAEMAALNFSVRWQRQRHWQDMNGDATRDATEHWEPPVKIKAFGAENVP